MERDSEEVWVSSYAGMFAYYREKARPWYHWALPWLSPTHWKLQQFTEQCVMFSTASTDAVNRTDPCLSMWRTQYLQHNAAVRALVPPEQLLVVKVGEGWERLCTFLGKPIPATPWPHENQAGAKGNIVDQVGEFALYKRADREAFVNFSLLLIACTAAFFGLKKKLCS